MLSAPAVIAFEQVGDGDHHIKDGVVVAAIGEGAALEGFPEVEQIQLRQSVTLLKGRKGVAWAEGRELAGGAAALLVEQGANQGKGSAEKGEQGQWSKALKGSGRVWPAWSQEPPRSQIGRAHV